MPDLHQLTRETLENAYLMSLAIYDENGPWVADVIYVFDDDFTLYWMSSTDRRHSKAIDAGNNKVAATITATLYSQDLDDGIQLCGVASRVEHPPLWLLRQWMKKKKKPITSAIGAVLTDHEWYQLVPDRIELINEEHFDYDRQTVR